MPGKSQNQVVAARIAEGVKKGTAKAKPGSPSAQMAKSMSLPDIKEFAATPTGGLPKKARKKAAPKPSPAPGMTLPPSPAPAIPKAPSVARPKVTPAAAPAPMPKPMAAPKPAAPPAMAPAPAMQPPAQRPPIFGKTLRKKNTWR